MLPALVEFEPKGTHHLHGLARIGPGEGVTFTWHPGRDPVEAALVVVSFTAASSGTQVELAHSGWAARSDGASARESDVTGWAAVLNRYVAAQPPMTPATMLNP